MKTFSSYPFKGRDKWSSCKIISIYYFCFQPVLPKGLIICTESPPGSGEGAVPWKTRGVDEGSTQTSGTNNRHQDTFTCQVPAHSMCVVVRRCELHRGSLSLPSTTLCCPVSCLHSFSGLLMTGSAQFT